MTAAPFRVRDAVICSLGGPWQHLHGKHLQVEEIRPAQTYPGGWAVRLGGAAHLHVPSAIWVGSANLAPVVLGTPGKNAYRPIAVARRAAATATYRTQGAPARRLIETTQILSALAAVTGLCAILALVKSATARGPLAGPRVAPWPRKTLNRAKLEEDIRAFCATHDIDAAEIWSTKRSRPICLARDKVIHWLRCERHLSLPQIGALLNRDHTGVLAAVRRHEARVAARRAA